MRRMKLRNKINRMLLLTLFLGVIGMILSLLGVYSFAIYDKKKSSSIDIDEQILNSLSLQVKMINENNNVNDNKLFKDDLEFAFYQLMEKYKFNSLNLYPHDSVQQNDECFLNQLGQTICFEENSRLMNAYIPLIWDGKQYGMLRIEKEVNIHRPRYDIVVYTTLFYLLFLLHVFLILNHILKDFEIQFAGLKKSIEHPNIDLSDDLDIDEFKQLHSTFRESFLRENDLIRKASHISIARQVSHDIRSPLAALETILSQIDSLTKSKQELIKNATLRIKDIANNLLCQSSEEEATKIETDLYKVHDLLIPLVKEKRVEFSKLKKVSIDYKLPEFISNRLINVNQVEFKRLLSNLINNSIESISEDGKIEILVNLVDQNIRIEIKDNGHGIPQELLPIVTEKGTTYGKSQGSGLGLFHAKEMMKLWKGRLEILSNVNDGTSVILILPSQNNINEYPDYVLIDNDFLVRETWKISAQKNNKKLYAFESLSDFLKKCKDIEKRTPIYIDQNLNDGKLGTKESLTIYESGFQQIYLATSDDSIDISKYSHLKGIVGKSPAWPYTN